MRGLLVLDGVGYDLSLQYGNETRGHWAIDLPLLLAPSSAPSALAAAASIAAQEAHPRPLHEDISKQDEDEQVPTPPLPDLPDPVNVDGCYTYYFAFGAQDGTHNTTHTNRGGGGGRCQGNISLTRCCLVSVLIRCWLWWFNLIRGWLLLCVSPLLVGRLGARDASAGRVSECRGGAVWGCQLEGRQQPHTRRTRKDHTPPLQSTATSLNPLHYTQRLPFPP